MQELLDASHKNASVAGLKALLKRIISALRALEAMLLQAGASAPLLREEPLDTRILETLGRLLPSAGLSYRQALTDLRSPARFSWRGPATDLREALREVLDHLAPDADVTSQHGFRLEPDTKGPTMKQKARYVLSKRGHSRAAVDAPAEAAAAVEEIMGSFIRSVYTRSNLSTHTPTDKSEVLRVRGLVRIALSELLELPE